MAPTAAPPIKPAGKAPAKPQPKKTNEQRITELETRLGRLAKAQMATRHLNKMHLDVAAKCADLRSAATRIGNAYATAAGFHRDAVAKQEKMKEMETQLMFSILTVLTSGALSWATELVRIENTVQAASRVAAIDTMVKKANLYYAPGIVSALKYQAQTMKDVLAKQVSKREVMTTVVSDTAVSIVGEAFGSMGVYYGAPPPNEPAGDDPDLFRGKLVAQIDDVEAPALNFLKRLADQIDSTPEEAWDKYDDSKARAAYQDFQKKADELAGLADLPSEKDMADELERFIWAMWVPGLHWVERKRSYDFDTGMSYGYSEDVYVRLRKPVDDRLVALRIETEDETDDNRETEDKRLIAWAEKYLRNVTPWVKGKKS